MKARIFITFKKGVLEPQGKAVGHTLESLGFSQVRGVRVGRLVDIDLDSKNKDEARAAVDDMCRKLLANPVIEDFSFELIEDQRCDA